VEQCESDIEKDAGIVGHVGSTARESLSQTRSRVASANYRARSNW